MVLIDYLHFLHRVYRYRLGTEKLLLKVMLSLNLLGATVLDIGANRGIYSYLLSRKVGSQGKVHAFEPQPEMVAEIRRMQKWFGLKNIVLHPVALSSATGVAQLKREYPGDGGASLEPDAFRSDLLTVNTTSLDEVLLREGVATVDYIKCDVEGHELKVFEGALRIIGTGKPLIQVEVRIESDEARALFELFENFGYVGVMVLDGKFHHYRDCRTIPSRKHGLIGHRNFLFTHRDKPVNLGNGTMLGMAQAKG
jgi:FkbM family methyltransferase